MKHIVFASLVSSALSLAVCAQQTPQISPEQMQQLMQAAGKALGAMAAQGTNAPKAIVDFRELKELLPKELPGGLKGTRKGQKNGAFGMMVSEAEGNYEPENGGSSISMKITDISGTGGLGAMAHTAWASAEVENETDDGYEKTTKLDGFKAMEKFNTKEKHGEIQVFVDNRFIVEVRGDGVTADQLKAAVHAVDLKKLTALKPQPPSSP